MPINNISHLDIVKLYSEAAKPSAIKLSGIQNTGSSRADIQSASSEWAAEYASDYRALALGDFALAHGRTTAMASSLSTRPLSESVMDYCRGRSEAVGAAGRRSWLGIFEAACHSLKGDAADESRDQAIAAFSKALEKLDMVILTKKYRSDTAGTVSGHVKNAKLAKLLVDAEEACGRAIGKIGRDIIFKKLFEQHVLPATAARAMYIFGEDAFSGTQTLNDVMIPESVRHFNQLIRGSLSGDASYADLQAAAGLMFTLPDLIREKGMEPPANKIDDHEPAQRDSNSMHAGHCPPATIIQTNTNHPSASFQSNDAAMLALIKVLEKALDHAYAHARPIPSGVRVVEKATPSQVCQQDAQTWTGDDSTSPLNITMTSAGQQTEIIDPSLNDFPQADDVTFPDQRTAPRRTMDREPGPARLLGDFVNEERERIERLAAATSIAWTTLVDSAGNTLNPTERLRDVNALPQDDMFQRRIADSNRRTISAEPLNELRDGSWHTASPDSAGSVVGDHDPVEHDDVLRGVIKDNDMFVRRMRDANRLREQVTSRRLLSIPNGQFPSASRS